MTTPKKVKHPTQDEFDVDVAAQDRKDDYEVVEATEVDELVEETTDELLPVLPDLPTFREMMQNVKVRTKEDAVILRHRIQDVESALDKWKDMADRYLYNSCKKCEKAVATDSKGNMYAVMRIDQMETVYTMTKELKDALKEVEKANAKLKEVKGRTPHKKVAKKIKDPDTDRNYYYKVTKPEL